MDDYDRREFVKMSVPAFLGVTFALPSITAFAKDANANRGHKRSDEVLNWDAFLEKTTAEAKKQLDPKVWSEPAYVKRAAALAKRLNLKDPAVLDFFAGYENANPEFPEFEKMHREKLFEISLVQFDEGEVIAHHDHPEMTGVLLCGKGKLSVENFDLLEEEAEGDGSDCGDEAAAEVKEDDRVLLKRSGKATLKRGDVSTLTSKKSNIHRVSAKKFCQVIDLFTPPYDQKRIRESRWFEVDDGVFEGREGVYEAKVK
ncbi:MAG: hypothetical protein ACI8XO_004482 [Verrucomicrobiales bacterium]|jgi:hypothetical protein